MNCIGFKNFRRFKNFPVLEYGGITFLVGRNNAGKSTLVKALLLLDNYFKSGDIRTLAFGNSVLEDANIVTYGRALNNTAKAAQENFIILAQAIENYFITLTVSGQEDYSFANVQTLLITDIRGGIDFDFNMANQHITIIKSVTSETNEETARSVTYTQEQLAETERQLKEQNLKKTSKEYIELVSKQDDLKAKLKSLTVESSTENEHSLFSIDENFGNAHSLTEIVDGLLVRSMSQQERDFQAVQRGEEPSERFEDLQALKEFDPIFIESSFSHFITLANDFSIAYMGANPAKQSALFAIRDAGNALAQAVHDYKQLNIQSTEGEYFFVKDWMNKFEVGEDFEIIMHAGEAYEVRVLSNSHWIHLADKGMGSIQAMLLILRLACVIRKLKNADWASTQTHVVDSTTISHDSSRYRLLDRTTVIIEEPELNLHPALQSKLTELFFYVHDKYRIDFLIETHSEYMLRKSQVIVANEDLEVPPNENPFKVYYFSKETSSPYALNYRADGAFEKNFGEGFFDEASKKTLELLKIKRQKGT